MDIEQIKGIEIEVDFPHLRKHLWFTNIAGLLVAIGLIINGCKDSQQNKEFEHRISTLEAKGVQQ